MRLSSLRDLSCFEHRFVVAAICYIEVIVGFYVMSTRTAKMKACISAELQGLASRKTGHNKFAQF